MTVLRDCILWGMSTCCNPIEMNLWWRQHQPALKALRRLDPEGFEMVLKAKERAKYRQRAPDEARPDLAPAHPEWDEEVEGE